MRAVGVHAGARYDVRDQYVGRQFTAAGVTMSNSFEAAARGMPVELQADNAEGKLFGGAYCRVHFELPGDPNVLRVPATAPVLANRRESEVLQTSIAEKFTEGARKGFSRRGFRDALDGARSNMARPLVASRHLTPSLMPSPKSPPLPVSR